MVNGSWYKIVILAAAESVHRAPSQGQDVHRLEPGPPGGVNVTR